MSHHLGYRVANPAYHTMCSRSKIISQPNNMFASHIKQWKPMILRSEVFDWLKENMGWGEFNPIKNHDWKRSSQKRYSYRTVELGEFTDHIFEFKFKDDAMLFKLTWSG